MTDMTIQQFIGKYYIEYLYFFLAFLTSAFLFHIQHKSGRTKAEPLSVTHRICNLTACFFLSGFYILLLKHNRFFSYYDCALDIKFIILCSVASIGVGGIIWLAVNGLNIVFKKAWPVIRRNKVGFGAFFLLAVAFYLNKPGTTVGYSNLWYVTDYSMGFGSRFFIGQVMHLIFGDYITEKMILHFWEICMVLIIALISIAMNSVYKKAGPHKTKYAIAFLCLLYIAFPGSVKAMWSVQNAGRLETYNLLIVCISIILFHSISNTTVKYLLISLLCCISNAIYQGFVFMYYPVILLILGYDCFVRNKEDRKRKLYFLINFILTSCSFILFQFFPHIRYSTPEEMTAVLKEHSDFVAHYADTTVIIRDEMFSSTGKVYERIMMGFLSGDNYNRERFFLSVFLFAPIVATCVGIYMKCFKYCRNANQKTTKNRYLLILLLNLCIIPQFLLNCDWGRWTVSVIFFNFFAILYLYFVEDEGMRYSLDAFSAFLGRHQWLTAVILVYITALGAFSEIQLLPESSTLMHRLLYHGVLVG